MYHDILANPRRTSKASVAPPSPSATIEKSVGKMLQSVLPLLKSKEDTDKVVDGIKRLETYLVDRLTPVVEEDEIAT